MHAWHASRRHTLLIVVLALAAGGARFECPPGSFYAATIERTTYGIPHVRAQDWGGLGYGYGYAFAQDNLCILAREIVDATAEASRWFGPGGGRLARDLFHAYWSRDEVVEEFFGAIDPKLQELARGYAAGYNRHLRETGVDALPEACRGAGWVREIDEIDLFKVYFKLVDRAGAANLASQIVAAEPPLTGGAATPAEREAERQRLASLSRDAFLARTEPMSPIRPEDFGSNMVAAGRDATTTGSGMLLVNPHFPWDGPLRFYQVHVTIPGEIDSMGASLFGSPLPNIAFNRHVAWSHTVSTARRFLIRQILPAPGDPLSYLVDGEARPMQAYPVSVEVLQPDGSLAVEEHTFYETEFGPMLAIPPLIAWGPGFGISIEDPMRGNFRIFNQYLRMNTARSLDEFVAAVEGEAALPWVNTVATDASGEVYYGDVGTVPHVTAQQIADCATALTPLVEGFGALLLDGTRSECLSGTDADSPQPGIFGASNLPSLRRTDWVQNSNDSYWLTHPEQPLEGFSPIIGGERYPQSLRTRLGIVQLQERLAGSDGLPGDRFDLPAVQNLITANRNHSAELFLDDVLTLCDEEPNLVPFEGSMVDVSPACAVLSSWSRTMDTDAVGALLWRTAWPRIEDVPDLFAVPFDPMDAVNTPRGIALADAAVRDGVMEQLASAVAFLADNGLAVDAAWGDTHFDERNGEAIPIPGGPGGHGIYNAISSGFRSEEGYTPITGGSSIVAAIQFVDGGVEARAVLTYSQSTDPDSPHFADQTRLFSSEGWNPLPFRPDEIRAERISKIRIVERRPGSRRPDRRDWRP